MIRKEWIIARQRRVGYLSRLEKLAYSNKIQISKETDKVEDSKLISLVAINAFPSPVFLICNLEFIIFYLCRFMVKSKWGNVTSVSESMNRTEHWRWYFCFIKKWTRLSKAKLWEISKYYGNRLSVLKNYRNCLGKRIIAFHNNLATLV